MHQIYGLNHNKRILPVNVEGTDEVSPASLVTRRVDVGSNIICSSDNQNRLALGNFINSFTFPAGNYLYEINQFTAYYATGTGTVAIMYLNIGGVNISLDRSNGLAINTLLKWNGSILVNPNDVANFFLTVTVQPCNMVMTLAYVRLPFTP